MGILGFLEERWGVWVKGRWVGIEAIVGRGLMMVRGRVRGVVRGRRDLSIVCLGETGGEALGLTSLIYDVMTSR